MEEKKIIKSKSAVREWLIYLLAEARSRESRDITVEALSQGELTAKYGSRETWDISVN